MTSNELMRYVTREVSVPHADRPVARGAKRIHDEVRTAAFKADGALALAGHIGEGVAGLHRHFKELAGEDLSLAVELSVVKEQALRSVGSIQRDLYNDWKL